MLPLNMWPNSMVASSHGIATALAFFGFFVFVCVYSTSYNITLQRLFSMIIVKMLLVTVSNTCHCKTIASEVITKSVFSLPFHQTCWITSCNYLKAVLIEVAWDSCVFPKRTLL